MADLAYLRRLLVDSARGVPPRADYGTVHVPASPGMAVAGVFGFTAHHVIAAPVDPEWMQPWTAADPFAAMSAEFLAALAAETGTTTGAFDAVLVLPGLGHDPSAVGLTRTGATDHPRVRRAHQFRQSVDVYSTAEGDGVALLGRGVAGRIEAAFEVEPAARGHGRGRRLVAAIAAVAPRDTPVFFQCAPGNVASLRAILAAGARPVGSEVLLSAERESDFPPVRTA